MWTEAGALALSAASFAAWAVRGRSSNVFARSVWRADIRSRAVALTFDDGPSESTPAFLDLLAKHDARATFFACGANVRRLPGVARAVAEAGHETGNHSETHPLFAGLGPAAIRGEVDTAQRTIEDATGRAPRLFRAPFGVRWFGVGAAQSRLALTGVMWTVIGLDWKLPAPKVLARLRRGLAPGAILCLHDGRLLAPRPDVSAALEALRELLPLLESEGYRSLTVSELLCQTTNS